MAANTNKSKWAPAVINQFLISSYSFYCIILSHTVLINTHTHTWLRNEQHNRLSLCGCDYRDTLPHPTAPCQQVLNPDENNYVTSLIWFCHLTPKHSHIDTLSYFILLWLTRVFSAGRESLRWFQITAALLNVQRDGERSHTYCVWKLAFLKFQV